MSGTDVPVSPTAEGSAIDPLVAAAAGYPSRYPGGLAAQPAGRVAVLTCMDCRILPSEVLGLEAGQAHVLRNAGGVVTDDALRSLAMSQRLLGTTAVMVVQHTRCGMTGLDDEAFRRDLEADAGRRPGWPVVPFTDDPQANVRAALAELRDCGYLTHRDDIRGFVFDVDRGDLTEVDAD